MTQCGRTVNSTDSRGRVNLKHFLVSDRTNTNMNTLWIIEVVDV